MKPPLVSCLLVTYNFAPYLARSIESVLEQDYPQDRIQLVVVDDGSGDDTPAVVEPYLERVTYIRKENGGLRSAINRGLAEARGELIIFHSGDDIWIPGRLRAQVAEMEARPELGLLHADMRVIDDEDRTIAASFWAAQGVTPLRGRPVGALIRSNSISGGSMMVRASLRERFEPMPEFAPYEDWWVALRVAEVAEIDYLSIPVHGYRRHGANQNLGAAPEQVLKLFADELPMRRWILTELESELPSAHEWLAAGRMWAERLEQVAHGRGIAPASLLAGDERDREMAGAAVRRAFEQLAAGELDAAARECVRAFGHAPFLDESRQAIAALHAAIEPRPEPVPGFRARGFVTLADGDEVIEQPALLHAYGEAFGGDDDASLIVLITPERVPELGAVVADAGMDGDRTAEIIGVPAAADDRPMLTSRLTGHFHAVLSRRDSVGPLAVYPRADDRTARRLRHLAERRWARAA